MAEAQKKFTCAACGKSFKSERGLKIHVGSVHKKDKEKIIKESLEGKKESSAKKKKDTKSTTKEVKKSSEKKKEVKKEKTVKEPQKKKKIPPIKKAKRPAPKKTENKTWKGVISFLILLGIILLSVFWGRKFKVGSADILNGEGLQVRVVDIKDCDYCDEVSQISEAIARLFPEAKVDTIYYDEDEAAANFVVKMGIQKLPAYVFNADITDTETWQQNQQFQETFSVIEEGIYLLKPEITGANYFVDETKRKEFETERNKTIQTQKDALGISESDKPQIDFFVMSYCPFGNQAEEGIEPVYQILKENASFKPRYVIYENYNGGGEDYCMYDGQYCSMHGVQELHQNIRELCAADLWGMDAYFQFVLAANQSCTAQDVDTCWLDIAPEVGINVEEMQQCERERAEDLLKEQKDLNDLLGVRGSPSVFINGEKYEGGRSPAAYQQALCKTFSNPPEACQVQLEGAEEVAPAGGCGN